VCLVCLVEKLYGHSAQPGICVPQLYLQVVIDRAGFDHDRHDRENASFLYFIKEN